MPATVIAVCSPLKALSHIILPTDRRYAWPAASSSPLSALSPRSSWYARGDRRQLAAAYHQRHQAGTYGATSTVAYTAWQRRQLIVRCPSLYITSRALPCQHAGVRSRRAVRATCTTGRSHFQQRRCTTALHGNSWRSSMTSTRTPTPG